MIELIAEHGARLGVSQWALSIAEKTELRDIEYRHIERQQSGMASYADPTYPADNKRLIQLTALAEQRKNAGLCIGAMGTYRCMERNARPMLVRELVPMAGAGCPSTCRKYLTRLMDVGLVTKSSTVRGGYEIAA